MKKGFTLAEVLITLVVIGIIAAITIPAVVQYFENQNFKSAYKKAYSDLSNAVLKSVALKEFPYRTAIQDKNTTAEEWNILKESFKVSKLCENYNAFDCWADADRFCTSCGYGNNPGVPTISEHVFVDLSGRAWSQYSNAENIYLVDTNGDKKPNVFGRDRFAFTFARADYSRIQSGYPERIIPYPTQDYTTYSKQWCTHPPCYFKTWLYN